MRNSGIPRIQWFTSVQIWLISYVFMSCRFIIFYIFFSSVALVKSAKILWKLLFPSSINLYITAKFTLKNTHRSYRMINNPCESVLENIWKIYLSYKNIRKFIFLMPNSITSVYFLKFKKLLFLLDNFEGKHYVWWNLLG